MSELHHAYRPRYPFLEGMRGLSALYVVLHHAALEVSADELAGFASWVRSALAHGHYAVGVFIVLSGYCLMLPVAADSSHQLRGGFVRYLARRGRRILPPYYASVGFALILIAFVPALQSLDDVRWKVALPAFEPGVLFSHLLLIHNTQPEWSFRINPPFWSVATEWQIYFLFPVLLLLWKRFGMTWTVVIAFVLGYGIASAILFTGNFAFYESCPWYIGLFAMGMAATLAGGRFPWGILALAFSLVAGFLILQGWRNLVCDPFVGAATVFAIIFCARKTAEETSPILLCLLESRLAVTLGMFSYSLYLTHYPLLVIAADLLREKQLSSELQLVGMLLAAIPCIMIA